MGIDLQLVKETFFGKWGSTAIVGAPGDGSAPAPDPKRARVDLEDFLVRYITFIKADRRSEALREEQKESGEARQPTLFSIGELFRFFWAPVQQRLLKGPLLSYVMVCDDPENVPLRKAKTQQKRITLAEKSEASHNMAPAVAYPEGWRLEDDGVVYSESPDGMQVVENIDPRRLKKSDKSGKALWRAFLPLIAERMRAAPDGRTFVFDFEAAGPRVFDNSGAVPDCCAERKHDLGEAEPALMWWMDHWTDGKSIDFPPPEALDFHLFTTDTDVIPLFLLSHEARRRPTDGVYWHRVEESAKKSSVLVDLNWLRERLAANCDMDNLNVLALACILCGTDYTFKTEYAHGFGHALVLDALRTSMREGPFESWTDIFCAWLRRLYTTKLAPSTAVPQPQPLKPALTIGRLREMATAKKKKGASTFPSNETIEKVMHDSLFVLRYWSNAIHGKRSDTSA